MKLVDLQGLTRLVNDCTKPESQPFKAWVSEVIAHPARRLLLPVAVAQDNSQTAIVEVLRNIAQTLRRPTDRARPVQAPELTPEQLLINWRTRNVVVTEDIHTVAAHLAPAGCTAR
ncbi:hypothetical protein [Streptomyces canus]|uniref:hypothetical protein n=1 Tax=Streptomyces canus TaxID=58343 RepID=UPI00277F8A47|nr:hypothetical protein [Streptomyces canus]MDQ1069200.1 hypothetical protein [Streptomyces canus]